MPWTGVERAFPHGLLVKANWVEAFVAVPGIEKSLMTSIGTSAVSASICPLASTT